MRVRFWGTRGSIAKPGRGTVRYGGNTSCVEVRTRAGTLLILDCGTGAHGLGHALEQGRTGPVRGHLLFYAGRPIRMFGRRVDTLCLVDRRPREMHEDDVRTLNDRTTLVEEELASGGGR
jgi:hypothetical protein